jgi:predicted nucleic acid-binding protein
VRFWDASAIVPLLMAESSTGAIQKVASTDSVMLVWWATEVECASAVARVERDGGLEPAAARTAFDRLNALASAWHEVEPHEAVREAAVRFLRVHPLRAADAMQLGAAFVGSDRRPSSLELITLDERLATVARKEGFVVTTIEAE